MSDRIDSFHGDFRFLSNFFLRPVRYNGQTYKSAEHAYQAAKANTPEEESEIRSARSCGEAKRLGRKVAIKSTFLDRRVDIMREIIRKKFSDPDMGELLVMTGDAELIEGNTWGDTFWGQVDGRGENWLGRILMEVRDELRTA